MQLPIKYFLIQWIDKTPHQTDSLGVLGFFFYCDLTTFYDKETQIYIPGKRDTTAKDTVNVDIIILSANGSRIVPSTDFWFLKFLAINPSSYKKKQKKIIVQLLFWFIC